MKEESKGIKYDEGKPQVGMVLRGFRRAILEVAKVGTFGANKYGRFNFLKVDDAAQRYEDAEFRHWLGSMEGDGLDDETKLLHLAHKAWNSLAALEVELIEREKRANERQ